MAFALSKFEVTFAIEGSYDGDRIKIVEFLPVGADIAAQRVELDTNIATWLTNFNNTNARDGDGSTGGVSNAWVGSYNIGNKYVEQDNTPSFNAGDNLYLEAQLQSILDNTNEKASTYIPAPADRIFVGDSSNTNVIDTADAAYVAYGTQYSNGGGNVALSSGEQFENPLNVTGSGLRSVRSGKSF